ADVKSLADISPWRLAVVLETGEQAARVGLQPKREPGGALSRERQVGIVALEGVKWTKPAAAERGRGAGLRVSQMLQPGDVVYVEPLGKDSTQYRVRQLPEVSGAMVVMDP